VVNQARTHLAARLGKFPINKIKMGANAMRLLLLILLILLLIGALPTWPYSAGWGYYPVGGLGTLLVVLVIVLVLF
jgi:hypothetical protein